MVWSGQPLLVRHSTCHIPGTVIFLSSSFSACLMPFSARTVGGEWRLCDRSRTVIDALSRAMSARGGSMHQHAQRIQRYAVALAGDAGVGGDRMTGAIEAAALLHDSGTLGMRAV
jgi:HD-GYP domain-containing protein (c-di-GMP phosphodiesterase class II)